MPRKSKPSYLFHKPSGQARVRIDGKDHYLGEYGSPASREKYDDLVAAWLAKRDVSGYTLTVDELALLYLDFAKTHYAKNGEPTSELHSVLLALRPVTRLYGTTRARDFGPKALKAVRQDMIDGGLVRQSINRNVSRIKRMFRWAVAEELVPVTVLNALSAVAGLQAGRSKAKEGKPVKPVPQAYIDAVRPFVSRQVWGMIQLQLCTGARPGEIIAMRGCDLNTAGKIWEYIPESHKTEHHGKRRIIFIGPKGQAVLRPFLRPNLQEPLFSPREARAEYFAAAAENRKSKRPPSQLARRPKLNPTKRPGDKYTVCSYGQAIRKACQRADAQAHKDAHDVAADVVLVPHWHPHQLRHNAATELRRQFGVETARVVLGHSGVATTELYAEFDDAKARDAMRVVG